MEEPVDWHAGSVGHRTDVLSMPGWRLQLRPAGLLLGCVPPHEIEDDRHGVCLRDDREGNPDETGNRRSPDHPQPGRTQPGATSATVAGWLAPSKIHAIVQPTLVVSVSRSGIGYGGITQWRVAIARSQNDRRGDTGYSHLVLFRHRDFAGFSGKPVCHLQ